MAISKAQSEAIQLLKSYLCEAGRNGKQTVFIQHTDGMATNTGRSDYYDVTVIGTGDDGRPTVMGWLNRLTCTAVGGYRFNQKREAISVSGCGFNKAHDIAHALARIVGHELHIQGSWTGWAKP